MRTTIGRLRRVIREELELTIREFEDVEGQQLKDEFFSRARELRPDLSSDEIQKLWIAKGKEWLERTNKDRQTKKQQAQARHAAKNDPNFKLFGEESLQ